VLLPALRRNPAASLRATHPLQGPLAAVAGPAVRVITEVDMTMTQAASRLLLSEPERAERRAAEREQMETAIEALRSSEGWKRWLRVRRHFHTYSFHNQLLIASQCPEATRVAGFRSWLSIGYAVRKGEKAIRIWAPCPPSKKQLTEWKHSGSNPIDKPRTYFRLVAVFDRSQVDPLPDFPGGAVDLDLPSEPIDGAGLAPLFQPLADFSTSIGSAISVAEIPGPAEGYYDPSTKEIRIRPVSEEFSANAQVSVGIHELAHALVRHDHQDDDPRLTYAEEEVIAEAVAYTVCSTVGLDTSGSSIPYLATWSEGASTEPIELYAALIDRLARRLEDVALSATPDDSPISQTHAGSSHDCNTLANRPRSQEPATTRGDDQ